MEYLVLDMLLIFSVLQRFYFSWQYPSLVVNAGAVIG
jgi:hypothetical protein